MCEKEAASTLVFELEMLQVTLALTGMVLMASLGDAFQAESLADAQFRLRHAQILFVVLPMQWTFAQHDNALRQNLLRLEKLCSHAELIASDKSKVKPQIGLVQSVGGRTQAREAHAGALHFTPQRAICHIPQFSRSYGSHDVKFTFRKSLILFHDKKLLFAVA